MKWQIHKMASWHSDKLAKIAIAKVQVYQSGKITKQQVDKMASCRNGLAPVKSF